MFRVYFLLLLLLPFYFVQVAPFDFAEKVIEAKVIAKVDAFTKVKDAFEFDDIIRVDDFIELNDTSIHRLSNSKGKLTSGCQLICKQFNYYQYFMCSIPVHS